MKLISQLLCGLVAAVISLAAPLSSRADDILWASTGDTNANGGGQIFTINATTHAVTLIGNSGLNHVGGLGFSPGGTLFAADGGSVGPANLYTINLGNGAPTLVGTIAGIQGVDALAFSTTGTLYGGGWNGTSGRLLTINPGTGGILTDTALVGSGNSFVPGLSAGPGGTLWGSRGNSNGHTEDLDLINTGTGVLTPIGGATNVISDIWYSPSGVLYGGSPNGDLFSIDPGTGAKTLLFNTGVHIAGLTGQFSAVPEPTSLALGGVTVGVCVYTLWHRRRRRTKKPA